MSAASLIAVAAIGVHQYRMQIRVETLRELVMAREEADPLLASECEPDKVHVLLCITTIRSLISRPQQFHNRRVRIGAKYLSGFEMSAFFDLDYAFLKSGDLDLGKGIWLESILPGKEWPQDLDNKTVIIDGTFINRPSGHLGQYFGRLEDVELITSPRR